MDGFTTPLGFFPRTPQDRIVVLEPHQAPPEPVIGYYAGQENLYLHGVSWTSYCYKVIT